MSEIIYRNLLMHIIRQAICDYERDIKILKENPINNERKLKVQSEINQIEKFFNQEDFENIYKLNGKLILREIKSR